MFIKELVFAAILGLACGQFGSPFRGFGRPQNFFSQPQFQPRPSFERRPSGPQRPSGPSSSGSGNINYEGRTGQYHLSWRTSAPTMTHSAARSYCQGKGMRIVSFDEGQNGAAKAAEINSVVRGEAAYYWAGGVISGNNVRWENGRSDSIPPKCQPTGSQCNRGLWSNAGRSPGGQPETSNECLAILINTYPEDRGQPHYHDVACHHKKPTVCE